MMSFLRRLLALTSVLTVFAAQSAADIAAEFKPPGANWQSAGAIGGDPRHDKTLTVLPGTGLLVNNPTKDARTHLITAWEHGDLELDLDFLLTPGSNSGVYLMGRYEVQLFDSWAATGAPKSSDCGGIYERWDASRGAGKELYDGTAPRTNAARAPGLWQHLRVEFRAPRFDAAGKKIANAKFVRVLLNDFLIHENVEISGPTRSALFEKEAEAARGPLMIQGDHGSVALRNFLAQPLDATPVIVSDLAYQLFAGDQKSIGNYTTTSAAPTTSTTPPTSTAPTATPVVSTAPTASGPLPRFSVNAVEKSGKFALVITGTLTVPRPGTYTFTAETRNPVRLLVGDQAALMPIERGGEPHPITLVAGQHPFRFDYLQTASGRASLNLLVQGPQLSPQALTTEPLRAPTTPKQILINPGERTRLQRGFVPYEPKKRLYAISVGAPNGINYAYDFETGAILRVWRGPFLDTFEMWENRGEPQLAKPAGPALTLSAKPLAALLERSMQDWPLTPDALWSSQGYTLAADGTPTFLSKLASVELRDHLAPNTETPGLTRTLTLTGRNTGWETNLLLAEADSITPQPDGHGYIIGDREYYIDLPAGSTVTPFVRVRNGRQQLVAAITGGKVERTLTYTLVW